MKKVGKDNIRAPSSDIVVTNPDTKITTKPITLDQALSFKEPKPLEVIYKNDEMRNQVNQYLQNEDSEEKFKTNFTNYLNSLFEKNIGSPDKEEFGDYELQIVKTINETIIQTYIDSIKRNRVPRYDGKDGSRSSKYAYGAGRTETFIKYMDMLLKNEVIVGWGSDRAAFFIFLDPPTDTFKNSLKPSSTGHYFVAEESKIKRYGIGEGKINLLSMNDM